MKYIDGIASSGIATSYIAGNTFEKRNLKVIVFSPKEVKKRIWIDCGVHAREWISPTTCIWIIDSLVKEYKNNQKLNKFEIHIMPLAK